LVEKSERRFCNLVVSCSIPDLGTDFYLSGSWSGHNNNNNNNNNSNNNSNSNKNKLIIIIYKVIYIAHIKSSLANMGFLFWERKRGMERKSSTPVSLLSNNRKSKQPTGKKWSSRQLSYVLFVFLDPTECKSTIHWLCDYVSLQANKPATHHSRDLHSMIVAAFHCIKTWVMAHPELLDAEVCSLYASSINDIISIISTHAEFRKAISVFSCEGLSSSCDGGHRAWYIWQ